MNAKPNAPATERNRDPILAVLQVEFLDAKSVLEIGSGTGQHAVYFADRMPHLRWQTSDRQENIDGIEQWMTESEGNNLVAPLILDVQETKVLEGKFDAVFSANTAHIMSFAAVECMFALVGNILPEGGKFCLYGPFNVDDKFTSDSNRDFDASLKSRDPAMGIRDLAALDRLAGTNDMRRAALYAMPANNMLAVWSKR